IGAVVTVARVRIDPGRPQQAQIVVVPQLLHAQPAHTREPADRHQRFVHTTSMDAPTRGESRQAAEQPSRLVDDRPCPARYSRGAGAGHPTSWRRSKHAPPFTKHAVRRVQIRAAELFGRLVTARPARCKISFRPRTITRTIAAAFVLLHADRPYHLTTQSNQP